MCTTIKSRYLYLHCLSKLVSSDIYPFSTFVIIFRKCFPYDHIIISFRSSNSHCIPFSLHYHLLLTWCVFEVCFLPHVAFFISFFYFGPNVINGGILKARACSAGPDSHPPIANAGLSAKVSVKSLMCPHRQTRSVLPTDFNSPQPPPPTVDRPRQENQVSSTEASPTRTVITTIGFSFAGTCFSAISV